MKSYTFSLKFQNEINYFSQAKLIADIRSNLLHPVSPGFGRNVKKIKRIQIEKYFLAKMYLQDCFSNPSAAPIQITI